MGAGVRDGDCLCNRPAGVTFIEVLGQRVGLSGAPALFARWAAYARWWSRAGKGHDAQG